MNASTEYLIKLLQKDHDATIDNYVLNKGSVYHLTKWMGLINRVFNHDTYYYYAIDDSGNVVGILPLVHINSNLFGNYIVSMPYFNYGGVIADNDIISDLLISEAVNLANSLNCSSIEFRETKPRNDFKNTRTDKVCMLLELPSNIEELGKVIGSKKRSQVKRCLREGVEVIIGKEELINDFYKVFSENMRDLGTPVYSREFFNELMKVFNEYVHIVVLKIANQPISAAFLIGFKDIMEIPWASTLKKYNSFSPNMYLYWQVLGYSIESGYKYFDFGRSTIDSGTYLFKKQWGAEPKQLYWNYWLSSGASMPGLTPNNPKYKLAIDIWKRLPLFVTNFLGPIIVKDLP